MSSSDISASTKSSKQSSNLSKSSNLSRSISGFSDYIRTSSGFLGGSIRRGVSEENLRVRENQDKDKVWNHFTKKKIIDQSKFSSVILVKRRKSRRHWKKWRKDFEIRRDPENHVAVGKKEREKQLKKTLNVGQLRRKLRSEKIVLDESDNYYIVKKINLHKYTKTQIEILRKEVAVLKALDHPNIVRAFETYEVVGRQLNIVFEYCSGGDLWSRSPCSEKEVARIMGQILSAVAFMHERDFIHRDLKMENILFVSDEPQADVKVIDFGLSTKMMPDKDIMTQRVGTVYTMSPEVIYRRYTNKADMWALGVIAFALIADQAPFEGERADDIMKTIAKGKYSFTPEHIWSHVGEQMKKFVSDLIKFNPTHRLNVTQALNHPWIKAQYPIEDRRPSISTMRETTDKLMVSNHQGLKRLALYTIASRISNSEEIDHIRQVFDQYDTLNNGTICFDEFKDALVQYQYTDEQLNEIFKRLAFTKQDGLIHYTDFVSALLDEREYIDEDKLADAFDVLDCDDSGFISSANLRHFLDENYNDEEIDSILREADVNQDGKVSFEDFLAMFSSDENEARNEVRRKCKNSVSSFVDSSITKDDNSDRDDQGGSEEAKVGITAASTSNED